MNSIAAYIFTVLIAVTALFQVALAAGAPWGSLAMGGRYPGQFPPMLRVLAIVQMLVLIVLAVIVLIRAEIIFSDWYDISRNIIWVVVAVSVLSTVANLATPSKWERILWAPFAIGMLVCSLIVAFG